MLSPNSSAPPPHNATLMKTSKRFTWAVRASSASVSRMLDAEMHGPEFRLDFVGKHREHVYTEDILAQIQKQPWTFAPPGGESQKVGILPKIAVSRLHQDVEDRMVAFLKRHVMPLIDLEADTQGKIPVNVVLFSHSVAIKCLLRWVRSVSV